MRKRMAIKVPRPSPVRQWLPARHATRPGFVSFATQRIRFPGPIRSSAASTAPLCAHDQPGWLAQDARSPRERCLNLETKDCLMKKNLLIAAVLTAFAAASFAQAPAPTPAPASAASTAKAAKPAHKAKHAHAAKKAEAPASAASTAK